jgi:hypothetical protein
MHITLPTLEFELSGHGRQPPLPFVGLYFPTAHAVQATPSAPVYPDLHTHHALPAAEVEFAGQGRHVLTFTAACTLEYVLAGHFVHSFDPDTFEYDPAVQLIQKSHVSVKSIPCSIAFTMAVVVLVLRNSSATKRPAMSPLNGLAYA